MRFSVFYSWQSDLPSALNRSFIETALAAAVKKINSEYPLEIVEVDRDTQNTPGSPNITETILQKIDVCKVFVADVTIINNKTNTTSSTLDPTLASYHENSDRLTPNPNVLIELGYALKSLGWEKIILVQNAAFQGPGKLPFDLRQKRVLIYNLEDDSSDRKSEKQALQTKLFKAIQLIIKKEEPVVSFLCAPNYNKGQLGERKGELMHHYGQRMEAEDLLNQLGVDHPVWEWTRRPCGKKANRSTIIYGPYVTSLADPGMYVARFRIRAIGFAGNISADHDLLELDIHKINTIYFPGRSKNEYPQEQITKRPIKYDDLSNEEWHEFDLIFFYPGTGEWEFRILAFDGTAGRSDELRRCGDSLRIFFDTISIHRCLK